MLANKRSFEHPERVLVSTGEAATGEDEIFDETLLEFDLQQPLVDKYCAYLEMTSDEKSVLCWIAETALKKPLPNHWKPCMCRSREFVYFYNFQDGRTQWLHPCDQEAFVELEACRSQRSQQRGEFDFNVEYVEVKDEDETSRGATGALVGATGASARSGTSASVHGHDSRGSDDIEREQLEMAIRQSLEEAKNRGLDSKDDTDPDLRDDTPSMDDAKDSCDDETDHAKTSTDKITQDVSKLKIEDNADNCARLASNEDEEEDDEEYNYPYSEDEDYADRQKEGGGEGEEEEEEEGKKEKEEGKDASKCKVDADDEANASDDGFCLVDKPDAIDSRKGDDDDDSYDFAETRSQGTRASSDFVHVDIDDVASITSGGTAKEISGKFEAMNVRDSAAIVPPSPTADIQSGMRDMHMDECEPRTPPKSSSEELYPVKKERGENDSSPGKRPRSKDSSVSVPEGNERRRSKTNSPLDDLQPEDRYTYGKNAPDICQDRMAIHFQAAEDERYINETLARLVHS